MLYHDDMNSNEIRRRFLEFFEKRGHMIVPSSSLIPTDSSVLFTTAGMQQFKLYFMGEKSPWGKNVASVQKCIRTSDIDEVGDETHLTFFEMLGNFSFGGYWKREAIRFAWELLEGIMGNNLKSQTLDLKVTSQNSKLLITVFGGDDEVPADEESYKIWRDEIGIPEKLIKKCGREDNFWGPTGAEGPCGPTTEIHYISTDYSTDHSTDHSTELWNIVFNEYYCSQDKKLTPLKQKGIDTGMGLERLAMVLQGKKSIFETDLFKPILDVLTLSIVGSDPTMAAVVERKKRIIADHTKAAVFLAAEGILPSNVERGYVLRRLLRRAIRYGKVLDLPPFFLLSLAGKVIDIYRDIYPELQTKQADILTVIQNEEEKFSKTLSQGLKEFDKLAQAGKLSENAFYLYESYGFPLELTEELAQERGIKIDRQEFEQSFKKHQEISRVKQEKKFGGHGLVLDTGEIKAANEEEIEKVTRLHTATHMLQAALRQVLGPEVRQRGSDITSERLRFDFTFSRKVTPEELSEVENLVNEKIKENLPVSMEEKSFNEAVAEGALTVEGARYPEKVKVYSIDAFSKEVCGGPHVERTGQVGKFHITKEESVAAGIRRIRAVLL